MPLLPVFHPVFNYYHLTFLLTAPKPNIFRTLLRSPSLSLTHISQAYSIWSLVNADSLNKYFIMSFFFNLITQYSFGLTLSHGPFLPILFAIAPMLLLLWLSHSPGLCFVFSLYSFCCQFSMILLLYL